MKILLIILSVILTSCSLLPVKKSTEEHKTPIDLTIDNVILDISNQIQL